MIMMDIYQVIWALVEGDHIVMEWCLNCGQLQGEFPIPITKIEDIELE